MNTLFRKFLLYNLLGLLVLVGIVFFILQLAESNLIGQRLNQIENQALIIHNYLNLHQEEGDLTDILEDLRINEINSLLEIKNVSILILDNKSNILFDSKGYDLNKGAFRSKSTVAVGKIDDENYISLGENNAQDSEVLGRTFIKNKSFVSRYEKAKRGPSQNFVIQSHPREINYQEDKIEIISINPYLIHDKSIYIIAYEDNRLIRKIITSRKFYIGLVAVASMLSLLLFSIFLLSVVISPIKQLADSAKNIQARSKSTNKIINLNKRKDEIGDLSKILGEKVESLKDKIAESEEYSADLMHEIRNPLTSIKMATEVMSSLATNNQSKFISAIQNDVARIETIITDYSIMMKDEALMSSLRYKKINIQDLLKNIINEYKDINHKQLNFKLIQDNNINNNIVVRGHEEFIKRAIHNIYDNAISFSVDKGTIETTLSVASNYVTLAISDNGPGITELNIENIFNRFYTHRNASNEFSSTHSGLGLHIARQIIETHKGNIRAENLSKNNLLSGSRFIINV